MVKDRMIEKEHTDDLMDGMVIARLDSHGNRFEIILEADYVTDGKEEEWKDIEEHMPSKKIFADARKGEKASQEDLEEAFETTDITPIAAKILKKGTVQLTTEQRRKMQDEKKRKIVNVIARNAINPQTGAPHPPQRIELAIEEAKVHIDPFKPVDQQVQEILDLLRPIIPIRFEKLTIAVKLAGDDYGKLYGDITNMGTIRREEWQSTGKWIGVVEIPAGIQLEFFDVLNKKTKGNVETKIIR